MVISENLDTFLADFGVEVVFGGKKYVGFLDEPDQILGDSLSLSTEYLLTVKSSDIPTASQGDSIKVSSLDFAVREYRKFDDGKFARILMAKA